MKNDQLVTQIAEFCRQAGMAESTFGRLAVNDGKLVSRLREGKRITVDTLERIRGFLGEGLPGAGRSFVPPTLKGTKCRCCARGIAAFDHQSRQDREDGVRARPGADRFRDTGRRPPRPPSEDPLQHVGRPRACRQRHAAPR